MPGSQLCPLIAFDEVVGGKYKLRILWVLLNGPRRYGDIRKSLVEACQGKDVTPRVLSRELKELQRLRLITRKQYECVPLRVEYALTEDGRDLLPTLREIVQWGLTGAHESILRREGSPA